MKDAKVLVLMPVYNAAAFLIPAIESVLRQTFTRFELLIVDDESTDETPRILAGLQDSRITVLRQNHGGLVRSINRGLRYAVEHGIPFIARMDGDDLSEPNRLSRQLEILAANPQAAACSCSCLYIDLNDAVIGASTVPTSPALIGWELRHNLRGMVHGAALFRTAALESIGGCREHFVAAEDVDLFLRLSERYPLINAAEYLYRIRLNPGSLSVANARRNSLYCLYAIDCAQRRRQGLREQSFDEFEQAPRWWSRLQLRKEEWVLSLWRGGMQGNRMGVLLGSLLSPRRVVARVLRQIDRRRSRSLAR